MKAFTLNNDPLAYFFSKYGYEPVLIKSLVSGLRYTAVMLNNGNIGLCANLGITVKPKIFSIDLNHLIELPIRIIYNAYLNALINKKEKAEREGDIYDVIQANSFPGRILMIGYFNSVIEKFKIK